MKRRLKATSMLLAGAMSLSLAACGGSAGADEGASAVELTPNGEYPIVKEGENLKVSMFTLSMPNVEDFETNDFTKYMQDKTGIEIDFITAGRDDYDQKMNMLLQGGDYPEVFLGGSPDLAKYGIDEQVIIPLDDYITPELMPNYTKMMEDFDIGVTREADGKIYSLAGINDCYHCSYGRKMWINTKHLEEMGLDVPETTEEFTAMCEKFMEMHPEGIAVAGAQKGWFSKMQNWLMGGFTFIPSGSRTFGVQDYVALDTSDDTIKTVATTEEYRNGLRYIHDLYEKGAIYDGDFTQTEEQMKTLINQEGAPVLCFTTGTISNVIDSVSNPDLYRQYECMAPVAGPDGTRIAWHMKKSGAHPGAVCITDKCNNVEAVLRWADTFYEPVVGDLRSQFGPNEGEDWILNPEGEVGLNGEPALYKILNEYSPEPQNHDWQDLGIRVAPASYRLGAATDPNVDPYSPEGLEKLLFMASKEKYEPYADNTTLENLHELKVSNDEKNEVATIAVEIEKIMEEDGVAFMTGKKDIETDWDAYVESIDKAGLQKLLDVYQTAYDRQNKK